MSRNLHEKHRERVRKEFFANGIDHETPEHKVLEMLLFYCIPRKNTNEMAHELINRFGSFSAVLDASPRELMEINGIGERAAMFLKLIIPIARYYVADKQKSKVEYSNMDHLCQDICDMYFGYTNEVFAVISLNNKGQRLGFDIICEGDVSLVGVSVRDVIEIVLKRRATTVVIAHNHPSGLATPSVSDIETTEMINNALSGINVKLLDHIIVVPDDYVSLRQSAQFKHLFD